MRRAALGTLALLTACHRHDDPSSTAAPSHPKDSGPCAAIAQARHNADAGEIPGAGASCMVTKHGAWGMVLDDQPMRTNMPQFSFQLSLHATHASGSTWVAGAKESWRDIAKMEVFDFDGDGEEELIVEGNGIPCRISGDGLCTEPLPLVEIFTFKSGAVSPLPQLDTVRPPAGFLKSEIFLTSPGKFQRDDRSVLFDKIDDVDHDGRPDLFSPLFYVINGTDGDVSSYLGEGPHFVAHSLADGSFSLADAVAMDALRKECEAAPQLDNANGRELVASAVCARLDGQSVSQIRQKYNARCVAILRENAKKQGDAVDWFGNPLCRTETEGGWSNTTGIPVSLVKMLEETSPLPSKP